MLYRFRTLRDGYPTTSVRIAVASGTALAAYLVARRAS